MYRFRFTEYWFKKAGCFFEGFVRLANRPNSSFASWLLSEREQIVDLRLKGIREQPRGLQGIKGSAERLKGMRDQPRGTDRSPFPLLEDFLENLPSGVASM